jgi:hypothetical protein
MRTTFSHYYVPSDKDFAKLWDEAIFAFDANVLLNLYRYTDQTCAVLMSLMETPRRRNG